MTFALSSPLPLSPSLLLNRCSYEVLGHFFDDARDGMHPGDVVPLCSTATSPAANAIREYTRRLADDMHPSWLPISGPDRAWTQSSYNAAAKGAYTMIGGLLLRCVWPYSFWPFPLAVLFNLLAPDAVKHSVRRNFFRARGCCGEWFFKRVRDIFVTEADLDAEMPFLSDVFTMAPNSNVRTECRFARMKNHCRSCQGNMPGPASTFAEHVLSESWCMLKAAERR